MAATDNVQDARRPGGGTGVPGTGPGRIHAAAVVTVVLVGAAVRLIHLDQPVRYDEAVTYLRYVSRPLSDALSSYDLPNNHLFHTLLAHAAIDAFGDTLESLRLPAWGAGTLVVPAVYGIGRLVRGPRTGLVAAAMAAVSPVLVFFSVNARGYSLVVLAFLVMAGCGWVLMRRWSPSAWAGFVVAAALGAWTIPAMVYPAAAVAAWWIAGTAAGERSLLPSLAEAAGAGLAAAGLAALLYLPVFRGAGVEAVTGNRFVRPEPLGAFAASVPGFVAEVARTWAHGVPPWATGLLAVGVAGECIAWIRGGRRAAPPLFAVGLVTSFAVLGLSRRTPFARVWLFLLPALLLFGASGLVRMTERVVRRTAADESRSRWRDSVVSGLAVLLAVAVGWHGVAGGAVREWGLTGSLPAGDRVAAFVADHWQRGDVVRARIPSDGPLQFYLRRRGLPGSVVNGRPEPGSCVFVVVNRRHGQTVSGVAGARESDGRPPPRLLREWGETAVYALPRRADRNKKKSDGSGTGDGPCPSARRP